MILFLLFRLFVLFTGDAAYPVSSFMITPFKDTGRLTEAQKFFNRQVLSARQTVERAIGHIKGRFRRLRDLYCHDIREICEIIISGCILHNLCIICQDDIEYYFVPDNENIVINNYQVVGNAAAGVNRRNQLVQFMSQFM